MLAVKASIFELPWADAGFGIDTTDLVRWWGRFESAGLPIWWGLPDGWPLPAGPVPSNLRFLRRLSPAEISTDPSVAYTGGTSGLAALCSFAVHKRAKRIVLFGYDYIGRPGHWHVEESHYDASHGYSNENWLDWAKRIDKLAPHLAELGMTVINASPDSTIGAFPKVTPEDGIAIVSGSVETSLWDRTPANSANPARAYEAPPT